MQYKISIISLIILGIIYIISRYVYFNPTNSEIKGYYLVYKPITYVKNDLVLVCIRDPQSIEVLYKFKLPRTKKEKCELPFLLKKVAAKFGDKIEITNMGIKINDVLLANTEALRQVRGISLNRLTIGTKYILNKNEYFLLGEGSNSYDSRYFGVVKKDDLRYKAILLWQRDRTIF